MIEALKPVRHALIDELFAMGDAIRADTGVARPVKRSFFRAVKEDRYNDKAVLQKESQFIADYLSDLTYALEQSIQIGFQKAKTYRSVYDETRDMTRSIYAEEGADPSARLDVIDKTKSKTLAHIFEMNNGIRRSLMDLQTQTTQFDSLASRLNLVLVKHGLGHDSLSAATVKLGQIIKTAAYTA